MSNLLTEGRDYYILADGRLVFTAEYLSRRGFCCGNGCMNCPYEYINVPAAKRNELLEQKRINEKRNYH